MRRVPVGARKAIEVRAEASNLLDTPPLGAPSAVLGAADFRNDHQRRRPRVVQLAVKMSGQ
jgi:hypothetical protein